MHQSNIKGFESEILKPNDKLIHLKMVMDDESMKNFEDMISTINLITK